MKPIRANKNVRQTDEMTEPGEASTRALRRGLSILDAVSRSGVEGLRVVDLCEQCGLGRATVHRLLETLLDTGHVQRMGRFRYVVTGGGMTPTRRATHSNLAVLLQPALTQISAACGDAAFAIVQEGAQSLCIARQVGTHPVQILAIQIGTRQPLGVGAAGLAYLSALPDDEVDAVIAANKSELQAFGGMTRERMKLLIRATRERGWSVIGNHATRDALAVGVAVLNKSGRPVAAISVASTLERMPMQRQRVVARCIRDAIEKIPRIAIEAR